MNDDPHDAGAAAAPVDDTITRPTPDDTARADDDGVPGGQPDGAIDAPQHTPPLDLDAVERDLADVETALERLDAGTYWTDEVTGATIPDDTLAADPITRRADPGTVAP